MDTSFAGLRSTPSGLTRRDLYERLRADIVDNVLEPGRAIPETQMVRRYAAGRSPLRDALTRLADEGLVRVIPQVGTFVSPLDLGVIREAIAMRRLVECEAVSVCAGIADAALAVALSRVVAMQRVAHDCDDFGTMLQLDADFHRQIVLAGLGPMAWRVVSQMRGHFLRVRNLVVPDAGVRLATIDGHETIAAAIRSGDVVAARAAMGEHMRANDAQLAALQEQHADFFVLSASEQAKARSQ